MTISLPKGYQPPQGAKPGEPFEVVAMLVASEDGTFLIQSIDGVEVGESEEPGEMEPEQPSPFDFPEYADPAQQPTF